MVQGRTFEEVLVDRSLVLLGNDHFGFGEGEKSCLKESL